MDELLSLLQDPANRHIVWAVAGFFVLDGLMLFVLARLLGRKTTQATHGGVAVRNNSGQIVSGHVGGDVIQQQAGTPPNGGGANTGPLLNLLGSVSSIIGLGLAVMALL